MIRLLTQLLKYLVLLFLVAWAAVAGAQVNTCTWAFPYAGTCMNVVEACVPQEPAACARPVNTSVWMLGSNIAWHGVGACAANGDMITAGWAPAVDTAHWLGFSVSAMPHVQLDTITILFSVLQAATVQLHYAPADVWPTTELCTMTVDSGAHVLTATVPCTQPAPGWTFAVCRFMLRAATSGGSVVIDHIRVAGQPCLTTGVCRTEPAEVQRVGTATATDLLGRDVRQGTTITIR